MDIERVVLGGDHRFHIWNGFANFIITLHFDQNSDFRASLIYELREHEKLWNDYNKFNFQKNREKMEKVTKFKCEDENNKNNISQKKKFKKTLWARSLTYCVGYCLFKAQSLLSNL